MIGTKLAHYEITSHIGSGGMGDVYQATDTKLGRSVAIKFLPEAFSHDTERVARFQREARVLASLNHPNIAAIHGVEEIDTRHFLVMELVSGETLADRIKRGAIPIEEALPIAKQIAEALEEAHEKGIIHRDLKPANIKVTPDGKVKVLDFGLAKAYEREQANAALSNSPTISIAATNAGVILGTAAYMSPEQARGKEVDHRTDIWAFGAVLYELLTGRLAFHGEDVTDILAAVVRAEPDWSRLPLSTPTKVRDLLRRCLQKDKARRMQAAGDVRIEIVEALEVPTAEVMPAGAARLAASNRFAWVAFAAAVLVAVGFAVVHLREAPPAAPPEMRTEIVTPATSDPASFALSPDGRHLVFVASGDGPSRLWLRSLSETTAQPLAGTEGALSGLPFWSPDSRSIGFCADSKLKRVDIGGGPPQTLANVDTSRPTCGGAWTPEGVILFASVATPILRIPASGGEIVAVTKLDPPHQIGHYFPQLLPGGRQFLFFVAGQPDSQGIYLGSLDSPQIKLLTAANSPGGLYAPPGWLLFVRQGTLVARRFDLSRDELTGDPVTVAAPVSAVSVSAAGLIAYRAGTVSGRQLTWFDRSGKVLGTVGTPDFDVLADPAISPNGRRVAVDRVVQGNLDVWLLDGTRTTRFTFDASLDSFPVWSPDGSRIVFRSNRNGAFQLYQKPSDGSGVEELLLSESPEVKTASAQSWSADGRFILFANDNSPKTSFDLWLLPLEGERKARVFLNTPFDERSGQFSPDGHWVAYRTNQSGQFEVYVRAFPGPGGQWQVSNGGGVAPRWRPDGKELYYIAPAGRMMSVPIASKGATLELGMPLPLFQTRIVGGGTNINRPQYDVAPDGRFLIDIITENTIVPAITLLQNWKPAK